MALTGTRCWFLTLLAAMLKSSPSYERCRSVSMHGFWFSTRPRLDLLDFSGSYKSEGRRKDSTLLALLMIGTTETRAWLMNLLSGKTGLLRNLRKMSTFTLWIWLMTKVNKTQFCPRLSLSWANNNKYCFHRFDSVIDINFIKAWRHLCQNKFDDLDWTRVNQYLEDSQIIRLYIPRTLILTDDLFIKDLTEDFIYYLSQEDHTIAQIDATQISDSKMK